MTERPDSNSVDGEAESPRPTIPPSAEAEVSAAPGSPAQLDSTPGTDLPLPSAPTGGAPDEGVAATEATEAPTAESPAEGTPASDAADTSAAPAASTDTDAADPIAPADNPCDALPAPAADESFSALLESDGKVADHNQSATSGDRISGVLVKVTAENSFVDFGGRGEGVIKTSELQDEEGKMVFDVGDPLEAFVVSDEDEIVLSRSLQRGDRQADLIYQAFKSGMPVQGRVTAVNKWGLGVDVQGVKAFCPVSQISTEFVKSTEEYRDQSMQFKIIRFRDQGRTVVLSRRALLEVEQEKETDAVRSLLKKGAKLKGKVTRLEAFGAFVELGAGVEGMVHVSELRHERVEHPELVVKSGEEVTVEVLGVKNLGHRKNERISLSLKSLEKDPWNEVRRQFKTGFVTEGKVDTLTDYGAFVELAPNVRGMVHVSEMSNKRIAHPRDAVSVGDEVRVAVLEVDSKRRRLRLSMKQAEQVEDATNLKEFQQRQSKEKEDSPMAGAMADALQRARLIE